MLKPPLHSHLQTRLWLLLIQMRSHLQMQMLNLQQMRTLNLQQTQMPNLQQTQMPNLLQMQMLSLASMLISSNQEHQVRPSKTQITTTTMMDKMEPAVMVINPLSIEEMVSVRSPYLSGIYKLYDANSDNFALVKLSIQNLVSTKLEPVSLSEFHFCEQATEIPYSVIS